MEIKTTDGYVVLVDKEDYPVLSRLNWYISDTGYAISDSPVKHLKMHKLIIGPIPPRTMIDHINRNKLDNRKNNLRVVSPKVNSRNSDKYDSAKRYWYNKRRGTWVVEIAGITRYVPAKSPEIAERIVKRLMLGFPVEVAKEEALSPTISITNWGRFGVTYGDYLKAKEAGVSIKNLHRRKKHMESGKISKRGHAKAKEDGRD